MADANGARRARKFLANPWILDAWSANRKASSNPELRGITVIQGFFDESYGDRVFAIGGFFGFEEAWKGFQEEWASVLDQYGVSAFHATDWENRYGEFARWEISQKVEFIQKLVTIINGKNIIGFHSAVSLHDFKQIWPDDRPDAPYFLCFQSCIAEIGQWAAEAKQDVTFVFEQQEEMEHRAIRLFNLIKTQDEWINREWLGSLTFAHKKKFLPLQAADFLAYEGYKHLDNELGQSGRPLRKPMTLLFSKPMFGKLWNRKNLEELKDDLAAAKKKGLPRFEALL